MQYLIISMLTRSGMFLIVVLLMVMLVAILVAVMMICQSRLHAINMKMWYNIMKQYQKIDA